MNRTDAMEVLDAVENGMIKLGQSRDIWQNDLVYTALQGVRLLLLDALKKWPNPQEGSANDRLTLKQATSIQCGVMDDIKSGRGLKPLPKKHEY